MRTLLLVAVLASLAPPARAEDRAAVRRHYQRALAFINLGDHRGAIEEFRQAYVEAPIPNLLYNLAHEYQALATEGGKIEDYKQSAAFYTRYLGARPQADDRKDVEARLASLEADIARLSQPAPVAPVAPVTPAAAGAEPSSGDPGIALPKPAPPPRPAPTPVRQIFDDEAPAPPPRPSRRNLWIGLGAGGLAVAGLAVGLGVGLTRPHEALLPGLDASR